MNPLKKAIKELKKAKKTKKIGVIEFVNDADALKMIAQQAQDIANTGEKYSKKIKYIGDTSNMAYRGAINQFGESLVNAAIELYNS